jgi:hypothetical protein
VTDRVITADASKVCGADFLRMLTGRPPLTDADRAAKRAADEAYWAQHRAECRRELEEMRDRLCAWASPELQAKWRKQWADEDARRDQIEARRAA